METLYIVDIEVGTKSQSGFTPLSKDIKMFSGENSLFDFIADVVSTKYDVEEKRIVLVSKYDFGGKLSTYTLAFSEGNLSLIPVGASQEDTEVIVSDSENPTV